MWLSCLNFRKLKVRLLEYKHQAAFVSSFTTQTLQTMPPSATDESTQKRSNTQLNSLGPRGGVGGSRQHLNASRGVLRTSRDGIAGSNTQIAKEAAQRTYENTYKTRPDRKFRSEPVQRLIDATLKKHLTGFVYNSEKAAELTKTMSDEILAGIKRNNVYSNC